MENQESHSETTNFKFRDLKIYGSTEWLSGNLKKYRQVFDRDETAYVYAELSFYNKEFDRQAWEVHVRLKCYMVRKEPRQICDLDFTRKVSKFDNIAFIREGWGNKKKGNFWKKGTYYWEAWIDGVKVATKYFYIEEAKKKYKGQLNPYFELTSLRLYEGQYDDVGEDDRVYYKQFNSEESRYIYAEIILRNLNVKKVWQCELFVKFYNEAQELKGQIIRLQSIKKGETEIVFTAGWGSNVKGSWRKGNYFLNLVFMDKPVASMPFVVGDESLEGLAPVLLPDMRQPTYLKANELDGLSFEDLLIDLDKLIGLHAIKKQIRDHASYIQFLQIRKDKGFEELENINIHSVFIGNPGTGKTTVAEMMGRLYFKMGLLSKGHVHQVDRVDLVGEYIGQTAPKVKEAIEKARGGVLFIDEAYALARANDDSKDFGREVIEILVKEMSNGVGDMAVIVAGYPTEMKYFMDSNPGLKSRFKLYYDFADYLPQELIEIGKFACTQKEVKPTPEAEEALEAIITRAFRNRDKSFGNARFVYDLIEKAKMNMGLRIMAKGNAASLEKENLAQLTVEDVTSIRLEKGKVLPKIPIDQELLDQSLNDLNGLIGLSKVKQTIEEMVKIVQYYQNSGQSVLNNFFLHTVFIGNPGTGKTSVARILTRIYKALGILERGHMVETDRQGMVAGFVGQTAIKSASKIDEARGGVLFIDEAYSLTAGASSGQQDFGQEAIQTLLKRMEDRRGEFYVFVAGYPDNMETFLKANPGLSSRFDKVLEFEDYNGDELMAIGHKMLVDQGMRITTRASRHLDAYFTDLHRKRDKYFGNARMVRLSIDQVIKNQKLRLAKSALNEGKKGMTDLITFDDVVDLSKQIGQTNFKKSAIGFKKM